MGDLSIAKLPEEEAIGDQKWYAPEQLQSNSYEGFENDDFLVGCVIGYYISGGDDLFENDDAKLNGTWKKTTYTALYRYPEAYRLIEYLTKTAYTERLTAKLALTHIFFWTSERKISFLKSANTAFKTKEPTDTLFWDEVKKSKALVMGNSTWDSPLDQDVQAIINQDKTYVVSQLDHLVRFVRNYLSHYTEYKDPKRGQLRKTAEPIVGSSQEEILSYFTGKFPRLMIEVYIFVAEHLKQDKDLEVYFK